jgi:hypothetical protein
MAGGTVTEFPKIGTIVRYPWGLGMSEGEVIDMYDGGSGPHVILRVNASGLPDDPIYITVTLKLDEVTAA